MERCNRVGEQNREYNWKGMEREKQPWWSASLFIGAILTPIGALFLVIAYRFWLMDVIFGACLSVGVTLLVLGGKGWRKSNYDFGADTIKRTASSRLWLKSWTIERLNRVCRIGETLGYALIASLTISFLTGIIINAVGLQSYLPLVGIWLLSSLVGGGVVLFSFLLPWTDKSTLESQAKAIERGFVPLLDQTP